MAWCRSVGTATTAGGAETISAYLQAGGWQGAGGWPGAGAWPGDGGLPEVLEAADRLGAVHRAASWLRLLAPVDPDRLAVPTPRVADWLELALR